jgi:hypothetical protein
MWCKTPQARLPSSAFLRAFLPVGPPAGTFYAGINVIYTIRMELPEKLNNTEFVIEIVTWTFIAALFMF